MTQIKQNVNVLNNGGSYIVVLLYYFLFMCSACVLKTVSIKLISMLHIDILSIYI